MSRIVASRILASAFARVALAALAVVVPGLGCQPSFDDDPSRVEGARILAVRADPPEVRPGEAVSLSALATDGRTVQVTPLDWSLCNARRALTEPSPVDPACLPGSAARTAVGRGEIVRATVPREACRTFGPDRPLGKPGEPAGRAADPDGTGGFYQPGFAGVAGVPDVAEVGFGVRIRCGLPSATQDVVAELERTYRNNMNPSIASVTRSDAPELALNATTPLRVARGATARLRVAWPACPDPAAACAGAERFLAYDPTTRRLVPRREALQVAWLSTSGSFDTPRTGRDEADEATASDNAFVAATDPSEGAIFVVLRDARGGVDFRTIPVVVE